MWHRHYGRVGHAWRVHDRLFDLCRVDVLATADDHLFGAAADRQEAVGIAASEVTGSIPAIVEYLGGGFRILEVPLHQTWPGHPHLTIDIWIDVDSRRWVDNPYAHARHRKAARARHPRAVRPVHRHHRRCLGNPIAIEQFDAEPFLERIVGRSGQDRARANTTAEIRKAFIVAGAMKQVLEHRGHTREHGAAAAPKVAEHLVGREAVHDVNRGAGSNHSENTKVQRVRVEQRKRTEQGVIGAKPQHRRPAHRHHPQHRPLRQHDTFGPACCSRRIEQECGLVETQVVGRWCVRRGRRQGFIVQVPVDGFTNYDYRDVRPAVAQQIFDNRQQLCISDDQLGAAVVELIRDLGSCSIGIDTNSNHRRSYQPQIGLCDFNAIASHDQSPSTTSARHRGKVSTKAGGPLV